MSRTQIIEGATDQQIADWLAEQLAVSLRGERPVRIALPGGSTPFPILERLVERDLNWTNLVIDPTDDRIVPEDHPASNTGKLRALFEPLGTTVRALNEDDAVSPDDAPAYDLVWLGMGSDGHVASLFPNTDPRIDDPLTIRRLTPDPLPPEAPFDRITLTLPTLLKARTLIIVIRGEEKRAVFDAAVNGEHDLPIARLLGAADQSVTVFA